MEYINALLAIAIALILAMASTRLMKLIGLPNVTGYLLVGLIIGPHALGLINESVLSNLSVVSTVALGFIAFSIGVEFKVSHIKEIGKNAIVITFFQALLATLFVDLLLLAVMPTYEALILGAIATATAPAATLMVVRQYRAKGKVTGMLLPVVALDDAIGLMVFAVSNAIALSLASGAQMTALNLAVWPILEIIVSLAVGAAVGALLSLVPSIFRSRDNRLIATICAVFLCLGICELFSELNSKGILPFALSDLLVCMMAGAMLVNLRKEAPTMMESTDRWTPVVFMLFFVLSGAELNVMNLGNLSVLLALGLYLVARSAGKMLGATVGATITKSDKMVKRYLGITLLPQAGVAIGMATMCKNEFSKIAEQALVAGDLQLAEKLSQVGTNIVTITMCAVLIYELFGPLLTKWALAKAGEIHPDMLRRSKKTFSATNSVSTEANNSTTDITTDMVNNNTTDNSTSTASSKDSNADNSQPNNS